MSFELYVSATELPAKDQNLTAHPTKVDDQSVCATHGYRCFKEIGHSCPFLGSTTVRWSMVVNNEL